MQNIPYQTFKTAEEAIASKAEHIIITTQCDLSPISKATHLKSLKLVEHNWYAKKLEALSGLSNLEVLDLSERRVEKLPFYFKLPKLKYLDLSNVYEVEKMLPILAKLPMLETLILKNCYWNGKVPTDIIFEHITKLDIRDNLHLDFLMFKQFPKLQELLLSEQPEMEYDKQFQQIGDIPLKTLHLELLNNRRKKASKKIQEIKALTSLSIKMKNLTDCQFLASISLEKIAFKTPNLPTDNLFENLPNTLLRSLTIQHPVECLPEKITEHQDLEELSLKMNYQEEDSPSKTISYIAELPKLKKLHLDLNRSDFPSAFADLSYVQYISLRLANNEIFLPKGMAFFANTVFESNKKPLAKKLNSYVQRYGKDKDLSDESKLKYFAIMLDQKQIQQELFPFQLENIAIDKTVFFVAGVVEGYNQKEIKEKLKEYGYKVASKLNEEVTHVLLGKNVKAKVMDQVVQSEYKIVIEAHLKKYFIAEDKPFLMDEDSENIDKMNENIIQLLINKDSTNIKLGLSMIEDGGASKQTITALFVFLTKHLTDLEADVKKQMRKVFKRYASVSLREQLKNKKDVLDHPEIDQVTFLRIKILRDTEFYIHQSHIEKAGWKTIAKVISHCPIKELTMWQRGIETFPMEIIPHLSELKSFRLGENPLKTLPKEIEQLQNLEYLDVNSCQLREFPDIVLPNLTELKLNYNEITCLPKRIDQYTKLEELVMFRCQFEEFPNILPPNIKELRMEYNYKLSIFPKEIKNLKNLKSLYLTGCNLKEFPINLFPYLISLENLDIGDNDISSIPEEILQLQKLQYLNIDKCQIEDISILEKMEHLNCLYVKENPLKNKLKERDGLYIY